MIRSTDPTFATDCTKFQPTNDTFLIDGTALNPNEPLFYLVAPTLPGPGSWGQRSDRTERFPNCPGI